LSFDRSKLLAERSKISNSIIQKVGLDRNVVVIVAVRGDDIEGNPAALEMFFSSTILPLLRLRSLKKIIIMSSSDTLCDYVRTYESEKIEFTLREEVLEHQFSNLRETLLSLVDTETIQLGGSDILVIRTWVQQTVDSYIIDQLSAYLKIFSNKDVAILVRKVKGNLYKDLGNSLQSFSLSEKNHYERDTLYERINGGFSIRADRLLDLIEDKQLRVGIIETE